MKKGKQNQVSKLCLTLIVCIMFMSGCGNDCIIGIMLSNCPMSGISSVSYQPIPIIDTKTTPGNELYAIINNVSCEDIVLEGIACGIFLNQISDASTLATSNTYYRVGVPIKKGTEQQYKIPVLPKDTLKDMNVFPGIKSIIMLNTALYTRKISEIEIETHSNVHPVNICNGCLSGSIICK